MLGIIHVEDGTNNQSRSRLSSGNQTRDPSTRHDMTELEQQVFKFTNATIIPEHIHADSNKNVINDSHPKVSASDPHLSLPVIKDVVSQAMIVTVTDPRPGDHDTTGELKEDRPEATKLAAVTAADRPRASELQLKLASKVNMNSTVQP